MDSGTKDEEKKGKKLLCEVGFQMTAWHAEASFTRCDVSAVTSSTTKNSSSHENKQSFTHPAANADTGPETWKVSL